MKHKLDIKAVDIRELSQFTGIVSNIFCETHSGSDPQIGVIK